MILYQDAPVGLTPAWKPRDGAKAAIWAADGGPAAAAPPAALLPAAGAAGAGAAAGVAAAEAGPATTTVAGFWPALMAACWAVNVVETTGQPTPGPLRFWRVTAAALIRASCDAVELSVGNDNLTDGLFSTNPALTFLFRSCTTNVSLL